MHIHLHTYIYPYTYTHIYTFTHTHTHSTVYTHKGKIHILVFNPHCCDKMLWQKQFKGKRIYFGSQFKVQRNGSRQQDLEATGHMKL